MIMNTIKTKAALSVISHSIGYDIAKEQKRLNTYRTVYLITLMALTAALTLLSGCGVYKANDYIKEHEYQIIGDIEAVRIQRDIAEIKPRIEALGYKISNCFIQAYYVEGYVGGQKNILGETASFTKEKICVIMVKRRKYDSLVHELIHALVKADTGAHEDSRLWANPNKDDYDKSIEWIVASWEIDNHNTAGDQQ